MPPGVVDGLKLRNWVTNRRSEYRTGNMLPERINALDDVGMVVSGHDQIWLDGLADLADFVTTYGHPNVPKGAEGARIKVLGVCVQRRRQQLRNGVLLPDRVEQLAQLGVTV